MSEAHTFRPSDEFRARLEAEILRRHRALPADAQLNGTRRSRLRGAAIGVIALILGATAGFASAQIGRNAQRDSLLAAARAEAALADTQVELARAEIREVERKFQLGLVSIISRFQADAVLADAERRSNRLMLDIEEITATGTSARDDLNAPVVGGRDFVKLRLEADMAAAQERLRSADALQRAAEARLRVGVAPDISGTAVEPDVAKVQVELTILAKKLELRALFLKSSMPIQEMTARLNDLRLKMDALALRRRLALEKEQLALVEQRFALGTAGEIDLLRAKLQVKETELSIQKMEQQLNARP